MALQRNVGGPHYVEPVVFNKVSPGDDAGTTNLDRTHGGIIVITGNAVGHTFSIDDATKLAASTDRPWTLRVINAGSTDVTLENDDASESWVVPAGQELHLILTSPAAAAGVWCAVLSGSGMVVNGVYVVAAATYTFNSLSISALHVSYTTTGTVLITVASALIAIPGLTFGVKDTGLNAAANNITIETEVAETIEGQPNAVIQIDGGSLTLQSDGSNLWVI